MKKLISRLIFGALLAIAPLSAHAMMISVTTLTGKVYPMTVQPSDTVASIKLKMHDIEGIETGRQRLVFDGRQLENEKTLGDLNIQDGATIYLIMRLRGQ